MRSLALAVVFSVAACAHAQSPAAAPESPAALADALDKSQTALTGLLDKLEPWDGSDPVTGEEAAKAQKSLIAESAAADALIKSGDELLARGIPREKAKGKAAFASFFAARGTVVYKNPTVEKSQRQVAAAQVNVAGHMASLIRSRAVESKGYAEREAQIEDWLGKARVSLERSRKQLASAKP